MSRSLTAPEYARTAALMRGRRIKTVGYYPLTGGEDGRDVEDWDFGSWHQPTMGVELRTDEGARFSAVWGSSFDHYGLEVFPTPITDHLILTGEPGGSARVDVTAHPCWSALVGRTLTGVDICWFEDTVGDTRVPAAIRLCSRETALWIAVGRPEAEGHVLGTDDVMVVFTAERASVMGIPGVDRAGAGG